MSKKENNTDQQESSGVESSSLESADLASSDLASSDLESTDLELLDSEEAEALDSNVDAAAEEAETEANPNEESDAEVEAEDSTSGEDLAGEKVVEPLSGQKLKNILEAALMAVGKPMSMEQLMRLFEGDERPSANTVKSALAELQSDTEGRGIELKEVATGYRYQSRADYSEWLSRLWEEKAPKYSRAYLETLALIAYRQPVTRAEIEEVRGVGVSSSIVKTMLEREWIRVVGHRDVPGRPSLYATTKQFLDYFNMKSLDELPSLAEIRDLDDLNPELQLEEPGQMSEHEELDQDELVQEETEQPEADAEDNAEIDGLESEQPEKNEQNDEDDSIEATDIASEYIESSLTEIETTDEALAEDEVTTSQHSNNPNIENESFQSQPVSADQDLPEVASNESAEETQLDSIEDNIEHYLEGASDKAGESQNDHESHPSINKD